MTEQKHTPGPWIATPIEGSPYGGYWITYMSSTGHKIAKLDTFECPHKFNAALIARAPDLLSENASLLSRLEEAEKENARLQEREKMSPLMKQFNQMEDRISKLTADYKRSVESSTALRESLRIERVECDALRERNAVLTEALKNYRLALQTIANDRKIQVRIAGAIHDFLSRNPLDAALRDSGELSKKD